jgi:hypothetical protein
MQFADFRALIERLAREVPPEFREGIVAIDVNPHALPHPLRGDVYTLGACVPLEWSGSGADLQSRVVLYYGSFKALARLGDFDWREEAWDTLTHELRHHLEWRANTDALTTYDWAAEENFKRHEGQPFDPLFFQSGEGVAEDVWKVDDDFFVLLAGQVPRGARREIPWHGRRYDMAIPPFEPRVPLFLILDGLLDPPPGEAVAVVTPAPRLSDLFRHRPSPVQQCVAVVPADG